MSAMTVALNPVPPLINGDKPPFEKQKLFRIAMMVIVSMAVILHLILMFKLTLTTSSGTAGTDGTDGILGDTKKEYCIVSATGNISTQNGTLTTVEKSSLSWNVNKALDAGCTLVGGSSELATFGKNLYQAMMCSKTTCTSPTQTNGTLYEDTYGVVSVDQPDRHVTTTTTHHCDCGPF
eukprot:SAG11_NODE_10757_length_807_cov_2.775424_1_plen_179_part_00